MRTAIWLILIGLFIWFLNLGVFSFFNFNRDWPLIFVFIGILIFFDKLVATFRRRKYISKRDKKDVKKLLSELEKGKINVDDVIKKIKGEK
jgi:hypothetical protein